MLLPWYISHYIRENFTQLFLQYKGKTVIFHTDDYNPTTYLLKNPNSLKIEITSYYQGFNQEDIFSPNTNAYYKSKCCKKTKVH